MTGGRLHRLVARHEGRRRGVLSLLLRLVLAVGPPAAVHARGPSGWWALAMSTSFVCIAAPYLLYWWPGATLLARLPIPGRALLGLAIRRMLFGMWPVAVAELGGAAVLFTVDQAIAVRALCVAAGLLLAVALITPALGALGGILATSDRLRAEASKVAGGQVATPPLFWLSLMPSLGVIGLIAAGWPATRWALTGERPELGLGALGAAIVLGGLLLLAVRRQASRLPAATRDVAALDAVKLATLQLDRARGLERAVGRAIAGGGRLILEKDIALARRRFPLFYILTGFAVIIGVGTGLFADEPTRSSWGLGLCAFASIYLAVMGLRLGTPPIERPRLLRVLPLAPGGIARAQLGVLSWRAVWAFLPAATAVARSHDLGLALAAGGMALGAVLLGFLAGKITLQNA